MNRVQKHPFKNDANVRLRRDDPTFAPVEAFRTRQRRSLQNAVEFLALRGLEAEGVPVAKNEQATEAAPLANCV
jgi:hypothetical protein